MADLNKTYLFRMTHIQNIPHILQYGITHLTSPNANVNYVPIGDGSLINTRSSFILNNGKQLGDYIPFYFGVLTPMLYVIQKGFICHSHLSACPQKFSVPFPSAATPNPPRFRHRRFLSC